MKIRKFNILPINAALLLVGLTDLATTLVWLHTGSAIEVNPIMARVLAMGLPAFIGIKLLSLAAYIGVMEWYRRSRSEAFARAVGTLTVFAYLGIYAISFWSVNHKVFLQ